jgi:ubiquinone/menaquinone biosynthesis C-methylase UbiE
MRIVNVHHPVETHEQVYDALLSTVDETNYGNSNHGTGSEEFYAGFNSILDIGGGYTDYAFKSGLSRQAVCDISNLPKETQEARGVEFYHCPAKSLPLEDNEFDVVCAFDCLEHIAAADLDASLDEIMRVCKHRFICTVPYRGATALINGKEVELHETIQPLEWWVEKLSKYGRPRKRERMSSCEYRVAKSWTRMVMFLVLDK